MVYLTGVFWVIFMVGLTKILFIYHVTNCIYSVINMSQLETNEAENI